MPEQRKTFIEDVVGSSPSLRYDMYYHQMADGTVKQINPFTGTEVWAVPGRGSKPLSNDVPAAAKPFEPHAHNDYCSFCETRYFETPPEKARLVMNRDKNAVPDHQVLRHLAAPEYFNTVADFRRVPNLFEIVTLDYWQKNYGFKMTRTQREWREKYLSDADGLRHINHVVDYKLDKMGRTAAVSIEEKLMMADAFFGGGHELIIARHHHKAGAEWDTDLFSSGEMTPDEHFYYFLFTIDALKDIYANNRYIRYVSVFQNWLKGAGASFDHLHKQLVGLDSWSVSIEAQIQMLRVDPNIYNEYGPNFAAHYNLVFAENEHAIALAAIGHRYPTLAVYSKASHARPQEHSPEEVRGVSELVHACHAAMGSSISCNEEWYYTPIDSIYNMPWHVFIKLRINTPAGFEGNTGIYVNPMSPIELRDRIVPKLYQRRAEGTISPGILIAEECQCEPNPLRYYLR